MNDNELINDLAKSIQLANEFIYEKSLFIKENFEKHDISFNIQIVLNFFYSIIETTDGIYSLTYDKNVGSINALARIQYESVIQFLTLLDDNYKINILSYEFHQLKELIATNDYLIKAGNEYKTSNYENENLKLKYNITRQNADELVLALEGLGFFNLTENATATVKSTAKNFLSNLRN